MKKVTSINKVTTKDNSTLYVLGVFAIIGITVLILNYFGLINDSLHLL